MTDDDGVERSFESARKASRMKEEKEVREPQNPVVRPMYKGECSLICD